MARIDFITGKGGVGKSTLAAAWAAKLAANPSNRILLVDVAGRGESLRLSHIDEIAFEAKPSLHFKNLWGACIQPHDSFKEYFRILLGLGHEEALLGQFTQKARESLTQMVMENKVVRAFVDACPGLEPIVLLGKIYWEASRGLVPESSNEWTHIVVDAPSSGHFLQLFRSTIALKEVFEKGVIKEQAAKVVSRFQDPKLSRLFVVTTVEELPLAESKELIEQCRKMKLPLKEVWANRFPPMEKLPEPCEITISDASWKKQALIERERAQWEMELWSDFSNSIEVSNQKIPYVAHADWKKRQEAISEYLEVSPS